MWSDFSLDMAIESRKYIIINSLFVEAGEVIGYIDHSQYYNEGGRYTSKLLQQVGQEYSILHSWSKVDFFCIN